MGAEIARKRATTAIARPREGSSPVVHIGPPLDTTRDPETLWTPALARRALGISRQRLGQLVGEGKLHPWRDTRGVRHFDRGEVLAYARSRRRPGPGLAQTNGRLAAHVFDMFAGGAGLRAIVRETALPPEEVRRLYREYMRPLNAELHDRLDRLEERRDAMSHEFQIELLKTKQAQAEAEIASTVRLRARAKVER